MEYFPDNTLANFRVKLGKPLILEGQYDVALTEIIYPHRRLTVQPSEAVITVSTTTKKRGKLLIPPPPRIPPPPPIPPVMKTLDTTDKVRKFKKLVTKKHLLTNEIPVRQKRSTANYSLAAGTYDDAQALFKGLRMLLRNSGVQVFLNTGNGMFIMKLGENTSQVRLSPRLAHMLGFVSEEVAYVIKKSQWAKYLPHLESAAHSLYIYSGIVDHQIVGNAVAPLLRVVCPDADKIGQTVSEKYIKPNYIPVNTSYIDTIDVQIRTTTGHLFPFLSGTPVVLTLHFVQHGSS